MMVVRLIEFLRAHLKAVVRSCYAGLALLVLVDAWPWLVDKSHAHTGAERLVGFWSLFGFVACALIIVVSKAYGRAGISQPEDYYDE
jgi:H+/Cl- antiporter ClcA